MCAASVRRMGEQHGMKRLSKVLPVVRCPRDGLTFRSNRMIVRRPDRQLTQVREKHGTTNKAMLPRAVTAGTTSLFAWGTIGVATRSPRRSLVSRS